MALSSPGRAQRVQGPRWVKGYSVAQKTQRSVVACIVLRSPGPLSSIDYIAVRLSPADIIIPCQGLRYWLICTCKADGQLRGGRRSDAGDHMAHGIIPLE